MIHNSIRTSIGYQIWTYKTFSTLKLDVNMLTNLLCLTVEKFVRDIKILTILKY